MKISEKELIDIVYYTKKDNKISYKEIAKRMGCSRSKVVRILRGTNDITISDLFKLFKAVGYELKIEIQPK